MRALRASNTWGVRVAFTGLLSVVAISLAGFLAVRAEGASFLWSEGTPTVESVGAVLDPSQPCSHEFQTKASIQLVNPGGSSGASSCVNGDSKARFADVMGVPDAAISIGSDSLYYPVGGLSCGHAASYMGTCIYLSQTDTLVVMKSEGIPYSLYVYDNFLSRLTPYRDSLGKLVRYSFDFSNPSFTLGDSLEKFNIHSASASPNGRWVVAQVVAPGDTHAVLLIDMQDMSVKKVASTWSNSSAWWTISDDGRAMAFEERFFGGAHDAVIVDLTDSCGTELDLSSDINLSAGGSSNCPSTRWSTNTPLLNGHDPQYLWFVDGDSRQLKARVVEPVSYEYRELIINAAGYTPEPRTLDYLALGDSYSSGEGDIGVKIDGSRYYIKNTGAMGQCHQSSQSYPFLLRDYYGIPANRMDSVACSGATVVEDMYAYDNYLGQGRRLKDLSQDVREAKQTTALREFIPGDVPQIEFVKKYKPKTITLTGGGNDIGFADILRYCATPTWESLFINDTCSFAVPESPAEQLLKNAINSQYAYNKKLILDIQTASPESKVVIVGYPSFIAEEKTQCIFSVNGGALNYQERQMIHSAVVQTNEILRRVAADTSVSYVDVQDSLNGGRLCEGSEYVTGITDIPASELNADPHDTFHPNAAGHQQIAKRIRDSGVMSNSTTIPIDASYTPQETAITRQYNITKRDVLYEDKLTISIDAFSLEPQSTAEITVYSDAVNLGNFTVSNNGSLTLALSAKQIPIGRHLVVLNGKSYSGEDITLFQFIEVKASATDADGDGIPDTEDACNFIQEWYDEKTGQDVCRIRQAANGSNVDSGNSGKSPIAYNETSSSSASAVTNKTDTQATEDTQNDVMTVDRQNNIAPRTVRQADEKDHNAAGAESKALVVYTFLGLAGIIVLTGGLYGYKYIKGKKCKSIK